MNGIEQSIQHAYDTKDYSGLMSRDGRALVHLGVTGSTSDPWLVVLRDSDGHESSVTLIPSGRWNSSADFANDLVLRPRKHKVWIVAWDSRTDKAVRATFISFEAASQFIRDAKENGRTILATACVELPEGQFAEGLGP